MFRGLVFPLLMALLPFAATEIQAQTGSPSPEPGGRAAALIVPQPAEGERDLSFQPVLFSALRLELERAGLEVRLQDEQQLAALAASALPSLLETARSAGADFLFQEGYIVDGRELRVEIAVYAVQGGERIAATRTVGRIGLRLDEAVSRAARALLPRLEGEIASALERRSKALSGGPSAEPAQAEGPPPAEEPAGERPTPAPIASEAPETPPTAVREPLERAEPLRAPTWQAETGAAPFFPMLALSEVFHLGLEGVVTLERLWNTSMGTWSMGLYAGYLAFLPADEQQASYFQYLVPAGLALRWAAFQRSRLGLFMRFLGGAAVNVSEQSKVMGRLTRILPQLEAGAGLSLALSSRIGISASFLYQMLFYLYMRDEKVACDLIMGLSAPSICVYTRW